MKSSEQYAELAEYHIEGHPVLSQVYATLAVAVAIKEAGNLNSIVASKVDLHLSDTPVYPDLTDEAIHNDEDLQVEDWINGTKTNPTD